MTAEDEQVTGPETDVDAVPICECCLAPYSGDYALFCPDCGAPVDPLALYLPYESILAEGFFLRRAVERPVRPITVIGIWLLVLSPGGGILASQIGHYFSNPIMIFGWAEFFAITIPTLITLCYWAIGIRCTANFLRRRRVDFENAEGPSDEGPSQEI